jgi:hypothetical protein
VKKIDIDFLFDLNAEHTSQSNLLPYLAFVEKSCQLFVLKQPIVMDSKSEWPNMKEGSSIDF